MCTTESKHNIHQFTEHSCGPLLMDLSLYFDGATVSTIEVFTCNLDFLLVNWITLSSSQLQSKWSLWPSSSLWKVRDPITKELHNHFADQSSVLDTWHLIVHCNNGPLCATEQIEGCEPWFWVVTAVLLWGYHSDGLVRLRSEKCALWAQTVDRISNDLCTLVTGSISSWLGRGILL